MHLNPSRLRLGVRRLSVHPHLHPLLLRVQSSSHPARPGPSLPTGTTATTPLKSSAAAPVAHTETAARAPVAERTPRSATPPLRRAPPLRSQWERVASRALKSAWEVARVVIRICATPRATAAPFRARQ